MCFVSEEEHLSVYLTPSSLTRRRKNAADCKSWLGGRGQKGWHFDCGCLGSAGIQLGYPALELTACLLTRIRTQ